MPPLHARPLTQPRGIVSPVSHLVRLFATSSALQSASPPPGSFEPSKRRAQRIPPEAPTFINTPNPPQNQSVEDFRTRPRVKGFLPVPREVFPGRDGPLKARRAFLERSAPAPSGRRAARDARDAAAPVSELHAFKRRMAASRRQNMEEGLRALWQRKRSAEGRRQRQISDVLARHKAAAEAPEPEDERLTRASVHPAVLDYRVDMDASRFADALASRERTEAQVQAKAERRSDAVQELYMNARSFIVDEAELEAEVERLFSPEYFSGTTATNRPISSVWDRDGPPPNVREMAQFADAAPVATESVSDAGPSADAQGYTQTARRQKRLAEELTGGKMDL